MSRFITSLDKQADNYYRDGTETRAFYYITDTITGLTLLILNEKADGEIVNIGNSHETTILQLAKN